MRRLNFPGGYINICSILLIGCAFLLILPPITPARQTGLVASTQQLIGQAQSAFDRGDYQTAKSLFEQVLVSQPNDPMAHTFLGIIADQMGNLSEAERHFGAVVTASPSSPSARNNYGAILLRRGQPDRAAAEFEASLRLSPNQPSAMINLAQIRFAANTVPGAEAARELFARAMALAPDAEIARALIITCLRLEQRAEAQRRYQEYAATLSPSHPVAAPAARAEFGRLLFKAGLIDEAVKELEAAIAADQNNVAALVDLAQAYLSRKEIKAAGRTLESAVARGLDRAPIYAALAEVYQVSGHTENAIPAMRLAIERDPKNEDYRFRYGMLLTDTKAPAAAIIRLKEALTVFPQSTKLLFALGVAQFSDRKHEEAAKTLQQAVELDPRFAPALAYLGMINAELGRYSEAIGAYQRALKGNDNLPVVHYLLADVLLKQPAAEVAPAESHLTQAIKLEPSFAPARLALAKVFLRSNRFTEAAQELEQTVKLQPELAEAYYQLGRVYTRLRQSEQAQTAFARFKQLSDAQQQQAINERQEIARRLAHVRF